MKNLVLILTLSFLTLTANAQYKEVYRAYSPDGSHLVLDINQSDTSDYQIVIRGKQAVINIGKQIGIKYLNRKNKELIIKGKMNRYRGANLLRSGLDKPFFHHGSFSIVGWFIRLSDSSANFVTTANGTPTGGFSFGHID